MSGHSILARSPHDGRWYQIGVMSTTGESPYWSGRAIR